MPCFVPSFTSTHGFGLSTLRQIDDLFYLSPVTRSSPYLMSISQYNYPRVGTSFEQPQPAPMQVTESRRLQPHDPKLLLISETGMGLDGFCELFPIRDSFLSYCPFKTSSPASEYTIPSFSFGPDVYNVSYRDLPAVLNTCRWRSHNTEKWFALTLQLQHHIACLVPGNLVSILRSATIDSCHNASHSCCPRGRWNVSVDEIIIHSPADTKGSQGASRTER
jgi:hypothetical protein